MADNNKINSLDSPSGGGFSLRNKIPVVASLSKNSKVFMFGAGVVIVGGILIGTLQAGNPQKAQQSAEEALKTSEAVGAMEPPAPPKLEENSVQAVKNPDLLGATEENGDANLQPRNQSPAQLTPAQQHKEWLETHKYQRLQGLILASEAALTSDLSKGNATPSNVGFQNVGLAAGSNQNDDFRDDPVSYAKAQAEAGKARIRNLQTKIAANDGTGNYMPSGSGSDEFYDSNSAGNQQPNKSFLAEQEGKEDDGYLSESKKTSVAKTSLFAGSTIPAVMQTGINSDLPGSVSAIVRNNVFDSRNENVVLIPAGSKLVGEYSSTVGYGQKRVLVAWNHLIYPDGSTLNLKGMLGGDSQGQSGFTDQVDNHYIRTFGSSVLMSLLGVGVQLAQPQNSGSLNTSTASSQAAAAAASSLNNASGRLLQKNLNIQPTLVIRPGYAFNVLVNKTITLPEYRASN